MRLVVKILSVLMLSSFLMLFVSCKTSSSSTSCVNGKTLSTYEYIIFGNEKEGDAELSDILVNVKNALSENLLPVDKIEAAALLHSKIPVLSPSIDVKTEKHDGGFTYITINLYEYGSNVHVGVIKSRGRGLSISKDQQLAQDAIKEEIRKAFKK